MPKDGSAQECSTSSAVIKIRTGDSVGTTIRWSVSNRRNCPGAKSCVGIMYESNVRLSKSVYS